MSAKELARHGLEPMVTIQELAGLARQSPRTIRRRIKSGEITAVHFSARDVKITAQEARRYLAGETTPIERARVTVLSPTRERRQA